MSGDVHVRFCERLGVRFPRATHLVMGFQNAQDARRMVVDLQRRLAKFQLQLHAEKTRLIEFGRLPALARRRRGARRPATIAFLGFTHYCGWTRDGRFVVKRKTQSQRLMRIPGPSGHPFRLKSATDSDSIRTPIPGIRTPIPDTPGAA